MQVDFQKICGVRAARVDLRARGLLEVRGADRVRFLDGMLTNSVVDLAVGTCRYAALLDRKGHLISDLNVLALSEAVLLDVAAGRAPAVRQALERLIIADDVHLVDLDGWSQVAFEGPGAREALAGIGAPTPDADCWLSEGRAGDSLLWCGGGWLTAEGFRALGPKELVDARALATGLAELAPERLEAARIEACIPTFGVDMGERNFPQEARLERALSMTKGCYIGQEIVARIQSRGSVNRLLVQLRAAAPVSPGAVIRSEGRDVGRVTSAAVSPASGPLALGYVRREQAEPGSQVEIDGTSARVWS